MRPSRTEPLGSSRVEQPPSRTFRTTTSSSVPLQAPVHGTRSEDSWIEIPSRDSCASLAPFNDDITTRSLRCRPHEERRSRNIRPVPQTDHPQPRSTSTAGSSQDEYDESESDSDRVMSSSNEDMRENRTVDDDDTATALGVNTSNRVFTPQPNAFSHPPNIALLDRPAPDSYFPPTTEPREDRTVTQRSYQRQVQSRHRTGASSYQPDHDAALRASLTTLLSCAAAVRPKTLEPRPSPPRASTQPTTLRLIPESELQNPSQRRRSPPAKQTKRKSRESSKERQAKKVRAVSRPITNTYDDLISPTLASWMISAGVVLVFSAISFSAGYAWGRDVGRIEGELGLPGGSCGQEAMKSSGNGLRKLRWSSAATSIRA